MNENNGSLPEKQDKSESCLFRKVVTEKKSLQEVSYVDHRYLKKTLLNALTLLAYGESCHFETEKIRRKKNKTSSMQHSWVLIYIRNGKGCLQVKNRWEKLHKGDIFLLPPFAGKKFKIEKGEKLENIYLCIYDTKVMESMGASLALPAAGILRFSDRKKTEKLVGYFSSLKENILAATPDKGTEKILSLLLYDLLYFLSETLAESNTEENFPLFLQNLAATPTRDHSLKSLAHSLHKDPRSVLRLFRKHTGTTPMGFLRNLRLEYAAKLLREGDLYFSMEDIARLSGYKSTSSFRYAYKRKYKLSPRQYSLQYRKEKVAKVK